MKNLFLVAFSISLMAALLAGCTLDSKEPIIETENAIATGNAEQTGQPTMLPTVTPALWATPTLTLQPMEPPATPTLLNTPTSIPTQITCPGAPVTLNLPATWAQVSLVPPISNNVRSEPGLKGKMIGHLEPGEVVLIVDGPRCADEFAWWFIRTPSGLEGWTAEGDAANYWLRSLFDVFFYDTTSPIATSNVMLNREQKYRIVMAGTYSVWVPEQWTSQGVCIRGPFEPNPMFPSPGKINAPVGADPYYQFARPFYGPCQEVTDESETVSRIMVSLDGGVTYAILTPLAAKYREDHTYTYEVIGQGYPLQIRLDDAPLDDNYGQIFIGIEEIKK